MIARQVRVAGSQVRVTAGQVRVTAGRAKVTVCSLRAGALFGSGLCLQIFGRCRARSRCSVSVLFLLFNECIQTSLRGVEVDRQLQVPAIK